MIDPIRRFERFFLIPFDLTFTVVGIVALLTHPVLHPRWLWAIGWVVGLLYLGTIGARLHPFQSASELSEGPLTGAASIKEARLLPERIKLVLVRKACVRVGIFTGVAVFVLLICAVGWRWYWASLVSWPTLMLVGGVLTFVFAPTVRDGT